MKFKVGDRVKILIPKFSHEVGSIGTWERAEIGLNRVRFSCRGSDWAYFSDDELELIDQTPVFKKGDRVKLTNYEGYNDYKRHSGETAEIIDVRDDGSLKIGWNDGEKSVLFKEDDLSGAYIEPKRKEEKEVEIKVVYGGGSGFQHITYGDGVGDYDPDRLFRHFDTQPKKRMNLSNIAKKLLDGDVRVLVEAGYLDTELELTDKGEQEVLELMFFANKEALAEKARKELAEAKKCK